MKSKSQKAAPAKIEWAGNKICGNQWFKIGLSKTEAQMVKAAGPRLWKKNIQSGEMIRFLLKAALAHFDVMQKLIDQDGYYFHEEGFGCVDDYLEKIIAHQLKKTARK